MEIEKNFPEILKLAMPPLLVILFLFPVISKSQVLDTTKIILHYDFEYVQDTLKPTVKSSDFMVLKIGSKISHFYSYNTFQTNSLIALDVANGLGALEMLANIGSYGKKGKEYNIFSNYPDGQLTTTEKIVMDNFKYVEPLNAPNWIIESDTSTMFNYKVQKATCDFAGRHYVAWFTTEVPVEYGPWKLHGLPGMIVNVSDSQNHFSFKLAALFYPEDTDDIFLIDKVNYIATDKEKFLELQKDFIKFPIKYINTTIKVTPLNPAAQKERPYNPMER